MQISPASKVTRVPVSITVRDASDPDLVLDIYNTWVLLSDNTPPTTTVRKAELSKCASAGVSTVLFTLDDLKFNVLGTDVSTSTDGTSTCFGLKAIEFYLGSPPNLGGTLITTDRLIPVGNSVTVYSVTKDWTDNARTDSFTLIALDSSCNAATTINFTVTPTQASCGGNNGTISMSNVSGGTAPYAYSIDGGFTFLPTALFTGLAAGNYSVVVKDSRGFQSSKPVILTTSGAPTVIVSQPASVAVCAGSAASFSVTATGAGTLTYQWRKDGSNIGGATGPSYAIPSVNDLNAGTYDVVITSTCGSVTSAPATLTANARVSIGVQPRSQTVCVGDQIGLVVVANGFGLTYQWRKNGTNIPKANNATLFIDLATKADSGIYDVRVEGVGCRTASSDAVLITVNEPAAITKQPLGNNIACIGTPVTFSVTATGTGLKYQWRRGFNPILNATNATYTINSVLPSDVSNYFVAVSSPCGEQLSNPAALTVASSASITTQPQPKQTVCEGQKADFTVKAGGAGLSYQWLKDGTPIAGATATLYSIPAATLANTGTYQVKVTANCGAPITSLGSILSVNPATSITTHPVSQSVCAGTPITFVVVAKGTSINYQWRKDGGPIAGATGSSFSIPSVSAANAGDYDVIVSGACGAAIPSQKATLTVNTPLVILKQLPPSTNFCESSKLEISVSASGSGLRYQWFRQGSRLAGETNASYVVASALSSSGGFFSVTVSDACGNSTPSPVSLVVVNKLVTISASTVSPASGTVCEGSPAAFSVTATGTTLKYQWRKNATPIIGATNATYSLAAAALADAGSYDVVVTGACGPKPSAPAPLVVNARVAFKTQPIAQTVCVGADVSFTVSATPTGLAYQWRKGGTPIPGATGPVLNLAKVTDADAVSYDVVITGTCGTLTSLPAALKVGQLVASITAEGSTKICPGGTVKLTANSSASYLWSNGATTQSITVSKADFYRVTVKDSTGCSATSEPVEVSVGAPFVATITASGPTNLCVGSSVKLTASAGANYLWSNKATTQEITVTEPGSYTVTVTDAGGCVAESQPVAVSVLSPPVATITVAGSTKLCAGRSVSLIASAGASYKWSTGETSAQIKVSKEGSYFVTVTDVNGCSATSEPVAVTVSPAVVATISIEGTTNLCAGSSVKLTASPGESYAWINGETSQSITVAEDGVFAVRVTNAEGCSASSDPVIVTVLPLPVAKITIEGSTIICGGSGAKLTATAGAGYLWSNGSTSQSITVTEAGFYSVTVKDANGCSATSEPVAIEVKDLAPPVARCKPLAISFADSPLITIKPEQVNDGSSDDCGIVSMTLSKSTFGPGDVGDNRVTMTVADAAGRTSSCETIVTVTLPSVEALLNVADVRETEGNDGRRVLKFVVELSAPMPVPVTVDYATQNGTALSGADYEAVAGTLVFGPGEVRQEIAVNIAGDSLNEGDEQFSLQLTNPHFAKIGRGEAFGTVADDDLLPTVTINDMRLNEGNAAGGEAVLTVGLSTPSGVPVTVDFATENGTANAGEDFEGSQGRITFDPGIILARVAVATMPRLSAPLIPQLSIAIKEGRPVITWKGDSGAFELQASSDAGSSTSWAAVTGKIETAGALQIYQLDTSGPLLFYRLQPNSGTGPRQQFAVKLKGDSTYERDETFGVRLRTPTNAIIAKDRALVTIANDDPQPTLTIEGVSLAEGDDGFTNAVFKVTLSGSTALPAEVDYATADGTAKAGTDFEAANGRLTFAPGETAKTITVRINSDRAFEADENFLVRLSNPLDAVIQTGEATGMILNDDLVPVLTIADLGLLEGDSGPQKVLMPVQLSRPTGQAVTVKWTTLNGTALAPSDYIAASGELTFAPGETTRNIELTVNGDVLSESDETFFVRLTEPANATLDREKGGVAVVAIVDDDSLPVLSVASAQVMVTEGDSGLQTATITVQLSKASGQAVAVKWSTADGTAIAASDYIAASGDLALAPGETSQSFSVFVRGDVLNEPKENFFVTLEDPANATIDQANARAVVTIENDDTPPVVTITDVQIVEGNSGTQPATLTIQLSRASAQQVSVKWTATDGTALAGSDYIAASGEAIFAPGETSKSIVVQVNGDTVSEPDELFMVNLSGAINTTVGQAIATVKIVNDDQATVLNILNASLTEGDSGAQNATIVVQLSQASGLPVTVKWATEDGSAIAASDYVAASGTLAFAPGETSKSITVSVNGDTLNEADEGFAVNLSSPTNATLGISKGVVSIINNDPLPALSVADESMTEGNTGTQAVTVSVTLSKASGRTVTARWATADDTALAASDYLAGGGDLTFAPGETVKNIIITVRGDTLNELDETFAVDLSAPGGATLARGRGFVKIVNDDAPPELRMGDVGILEGDAGTLTATLSVTLLPGSALPVSVKWATVDGTAVAPSDYVAALGDLTFAPGETNKVITLTVKGDALNEPDETFSVNLSSPVPSNTVIRKPRGVVAIVNDDPLPELSITGGSVTEGDVGTQSGVLTVQLSKISGQTVTVKWATTDGTALATTDYVAASGDLTFAPGETGKTISVSVRGDTVTEADETFTVTLAGSVNATISNAKAVGVVTIVDNEKPNVPPQAEVTSPEEEDSFLAGMSISLAALAKDNDGKISKVEFLANGLIVGSSAVEPFAVTWANIVAGTYAIAAVATDDRGGKVTSAPVHITVRADDGKRRVAIIQGSADPEITKMQSYLSDMDLISQPFRRDAITFDNLRLFDLVIWDDIGAGANTVTAAEVTLLKRLYDAEIPLYFVGNDLARQGTTLTGASRTTWSNLLRLNPATTAPPVGGSVSLVDSQDPVSNGPFGLVDDFKMPTGFDVTSALGTGETVIARATEVPVVLAAEDFTLIERTVTQNMFVFAGENLNSRVQREKLFKNAVWWLLQLPPPPPFLNLSLAMEAQPASVAVGQLVTVTLAVNHGGELEASGITVTLDVPAGLEFVSATSATGPCVEEDGVVVGQLGRLSRSGMATATVVLRAKTAGVYPLHGSVSGNQPEPSTRENDAEEALTVTP